MVNLETKKRKPYRQCCSTPEREHLQGRDQQKTERTVDRVFVFKMIPHSFHLRKCANAAYMPESAEGILSIYWPQPPVLFHGPVSGGKCASGWVLGRELRIKTDDVTTHTKQHRTA